ncbi:MAG: hypothetical protein M1812_002404 [Candelaria pacifica]|nr:MAG: hypothetical protein M1812_002404 [Candelaria pacifica]
MFGTILVIIGIIALIMSISTLARVHRRVRYEPPRRKEIRPFISLGKDFNIQSLEPSPQPAFRKDAKYHMTMGLRKFDETNWLTIDKNINAHYGIRADLLRNRKHKVMQCLLGSEDACAETLELVVEFLTQRYPQMFELWGGAEGRDWIRNNETSEIFNIQAPYRGMAPLEIAARLAMEDFNILLKSELDGKHHL